MIRDFNLLVTTRRGSEMDACSEIWYLLREVGDPTAKVDTTGISGLVSVRTSFHPVKAVEKLRDMLNEHPLEFHYSLRIIPIFKVVETDIRAIEEVVTLLSKEIEEDECFRITVEKRHTSLSRNEIIEVAAAKINRRVDLQNPDKVVLIEVVGGLTGISILKPSDILSTTQERLNKESLRV